jgi:hypothetical protein
MFPWYDMKQCLPSIATTGLREWSDITWLVSESGRGAVTLWLPSLYEFVGSSFLEKLWFFFPCSFLFGPLHKANIRPFILQGGYTKELPLEVPVQVVKGIPLHFPHFAVAEFWEVICAFWTQFHHLQNGCRQLGYSSAVRNLPSLHENLGLIPRNTHGHRVYSFRL